jgi:plasmid stabilization system protein ParE
MTGYDFHPEARFDLDEIWEFIRADNLDAADRLTAEILAAIRALVPFPNKCGPQAPGPHRTALALHCGARIPDCLRAGGKAPMGYRRHARTAQPRVTAAIARTRSREKEIRFRRFHPRAEVHP